MTTPRRELDEAGSTRRAGAPNLVSSADRQVAWKAPDRPRLQRSRSANDGDPELQSSERGCQSSRVAHDRLGLRSHVRAKHADRLPDAFARRQMDFVCDRPRRLVVSVLGDMGNWRSASSRTHRSIELCVARMHQVSVGKDARKLGKLLVEVGQQAFQRRKAVLWGPLNRFVHRFHHVETSARH